MGIHYILYTLDTDQLIMNCIAMIFIMEADEMVSESIVPMTVRRKIEETELRLNYYPSSAKKAKHNRRWVFKIVID